MSQYHTSHVRGNVAFDLASEQFVYIEAPSASAWRDAATESEAPNTCTGTLTLPTLESACSRVRLEGVPLLGRGLSPDLSISHLSARHG